MVFYFKAPHIKHKIVVHNIRDEACTFPVF